MRYVDPDGRADYSILKMGGYQKTLTQKETFDYIKSCADIGKEYSTDVNNVYVCTTFVREVLTSAGLDEKEYMPGGQRVVDSIDELLNEQDSGIFEPKKGENPSEGSYIFYYDYGDGTGHTGLVYFDYDGNQTILHNGSDGKGNMNVNIRERNKSKEFRTWFTGDEDGLIFYKKLEDIELWLE